MPTLTERMDRLLYRGVRPNWDDWAFRERIVQHLDRRPMTVLDLGAGAGIIPAMDLRGKARTVCGVDPDPRVLDNPYLDEARVGSGEAIPWDDGTFDLVLACNVLEHLERPAAVFGEVHRVLAPGGAFLVKTPNALHYVPLLARLTPVGFHRWFNRIRGRRADDTFPTRYRANRPRRLRALAEAVGLRTVRVELVEGRPEYLRMTPPTYLLGWMYERLVNVVPALATFRVVILAEFQKQDHAPDGPGRDASGESVPDESAP